MKKASAAALLFTAAVLVFPLTFLPQKPLDFFPAGPEVSSSSLNNYSLTFLRAWQEAGPLNVGLRLGLPSHFSDAEKLFAYPSYPATYLVPAYFAVGGDTGERAVAVLRILAFLNHFALGALTAFIVFYLSGSLLAAGASLLLAFFLPPLLLWQHNLWWPDFVGLTAAAVLIFLEARRRAKGKKDDGGGAVIFFGAACFFACLMDWFPFFLCATIFFSLPNRRRLALLAGTGAAAALHLGRVIQDGTYLQLHGKIMLRTGLISEAGESKSSQLLAWLADVWQYFLGFNFALAVFLLFVGLTLRLLRGSKKSPGLSLVLAVASACLLHWLVSSQHYPNHSYLSVRWAWLVALTPALFEALPALLAGLALLGTMTASDDAVYFGPAFRSAALAQEFREACALVSRHRARGSAFLSEGWEYTGHDFVETLPLCRTFITSVPRGAVGEYLAAQLPGGTSPPPQELLVLARKEKKQEWLRASQLVETTLNWSLWRMTAIERRASLSR